MIQKANQAHCLQIVQIHLKTLSGGFLAILGSTFLRSLYSFLIKNELVFVSVEQDHISGFVSFSKNSSGMMRRFLLLKPLVMIRLIASALLKPSLIIRLMETFFAPFKSKFAGKTTEKVRLPDAELLSISVDPDSQQKGLGNQLLETLEAHLKTVGVEKYKVIAGANLAGANRFYLKNGFILVSQITVHHNQISNLYVKELAGKKQD